MGIGLRDGEAVAGRLPGVMPTLDVSAIGACIADPPYGIAYNHEDEPQAKHAFSHRRQVAPVANDDKPFDPSPLLQFDRLVLWGANCYCDKLPVNPAWLCFDKVTTNGLRLRIGEMELAWARPLRRPQVYRLLWSGAYRTEERDEYYHPTQKPISLMSWCMDRVGVPKGAVVLDPFMGSGTTGVACVRTGRRFIGIEIERKYFETAKRRIQDELRKVEFLEPKRTCEKQLALIGD